jgi:hypothetical protein
MKTLVLDIETSPFISYGFKQWQTNIYPAQVIKVPEIMCFAWKWNGKPGPIDFVAGHYKTSDPFADDQMAAKAHELLSAADAVVTFNGDKFDLPHLHRLIDRYNLGPPAPYKSIDLRKTIKAKFLFPYNSLDYVCGELAIGTKLKHAGLQMWIDCMAGDVKAWREMTKYDKHDVRLTDGLYDRVLPWIQAHPNVQLIDGLSSDACPRCGETVALTRQGYRHTLTGKYPRYQCSACQGWFQGSHRVDSVSVSNAS